MRRAARTDANQAEIIAGLRAVGAWVWPTHRLGQGFPDCLVMFRGRLTLLEIKTRQGRFTSDEMNWHLLHPEAATVVKTLQEALIAIGAIE